MLEIDHNAYGFKWKTIWFSEHPYDIIGYDGVIFRQCSKNTVLEGFLKQEFTTLIIDLTKTKNELWENMSKSSCRYAINRAEKDGVTIKMNQGYELFYDLNSNFRALKDISRYDVDIEYMKKHCTLFMAESDGDLLGGQLYLNDHDHFRWLLGASNRLASSDKKTLIGNANKMMIWEAILHAKDNDKKIFDMGGYYTGENNDSKMEGINRFKKSFGGELTMYYHYQKDYSKIFALLKRMYNLCNG